MTLKQLQELRAQKVAQMGVLVEERGESMDDDTLATIQTLKDEIGGIDKNIEAIETVRGVAIVNAQPANVQQGNAQSEFRTAFTGYMRGTVTNKQLQERIMQAGEAGKGLEAVPDAFFNKLLEKILEYGTILSSANVITTENHGELSIPTADDTGNAGAWTAEGGAITPADLVTDNIKMGAHKVSTGVVVSTELLEDAFFDIETWLAGALGIRLARTFESAFINGDGSGKPLGIVADTATVNVVSAVTLVVDEDDMRNAIYALTPSQRLGAKFYVSDEQMKAMDEWKDTTGRPLLQAQAGATPADAVTSTLAGYPVVVNFELGDPAEVADVPVIFGNPISYWVRNIRNVTVKRSDELYALTDEVLWTATTRLDGKPVSANLPFSKITVKA